MAGPGICILCLADTCSYKVHTVFNNVAPYEVLLSTVYLFMADIANPDLFLCGCRTSTSHTFMRSIARNPAGPHGRLVQKTVNRAPIAGGGRFRHNLHSRL